MINIEFLYDLFIPNKYDLLNNDNNSITLFNKVKNLKLIIYNQIGLDKFCVFYTDQRQIDYNCIIIERKNCLLLKDNDTNWKTLIFRETYIKTIIRHKYINNLLTTL
jgi:hypothetical protein